MLKTHIKWGIIGTSFISEVLADAIKQSKTSKLQATGSRSLATANAFADKFSIPKRYDDYHQLLQDKEIDAVYIGLPNHLHKEWMIHCANAGKHVLSEKPFVTSIADAHEVIHAIEKANVFCLEALMYRYHPFINKLREIINSKIIGDIKFYNATYTANIADIANATAGGSIRNLGCYPVSLVRLLAQAEPIEVYATGRMSTKNHTDNQGSVILKFADGAIATISTADDLEKFWQFDICGTKGHLKVVSNPWMPGTDNNEMHIIVNGKSEPNVIKVSAEKPLYTYQVDLINNQILNQNKVQIFNNISLWDSLNNTIILETWLQQVKFKASKLNLCA